MAKTKTDRIGDISARIRVFVRSADRRPQDLLLAAAATAVLVSLVLLIGKASTLVVNQLAYPGFHYLGEPQNGLSFISNWDAPDYVDIAVSGYVSNFWVNWFPLFPITIHLVNQVISSHLDSALLLSWSYLVGALYFYIKVARRLLHIEGDFEPLKAVLFFVLLPTGVFLVAPYAEGLLAFLGLAAVYFALQKRPIEAGFLSMLAAATHITGIFFVILVGLILLEENATKLQAAIAVGIGSLGLIAYMTYLWYLQGRPLAFLESQQIFHHWTQQGFAGIVTNMSGSNFLNIVSLLLASSYWRARDRHSLSIFCLLFLVIPLIGHQYGGFDRYVLMAFPVPLMAYDFFRRREQLLPYVYALLGIAWCYTVMLYVGGYIGS